MVSLADLEEVWLAESTPLTERQPQTSRQIHWASHGVVIEQLFDPSHIALERYEREWMEFNGGCELGDFANYVRPEGWLYPTPYMDHPALLALGCNGMLAELLEELIGEPMGLHLCLTGWQSSRRNWHRDQYLNPPHVGAYYVAVWIAFDFIDPDSGPFQYVPGSHIGPPISQDKIRKALGSDGKGPNWPTHSERILTPLFEEQLEEQQVTSHLSKRGEVLVWHSRLLHRGSIPVNPAIERRALIMHFSGIHHRRDMPTARQHPNGGWYFPIVGQTPMEYPK